MPLLFLIVWNETNAPPLNAPFPLLAFHDGAVLRDTGWIGQHDGDAGDGRVDNGYVRDATRWIGSILGAVAQVVHIGLQGVGAGLHAVDDEGSSRSEYGFGDACAQVVAAAIVIVASQLQIRPACLGAAVPDIAGDGVARRLGADDNRVAVAD